MLLTQKTTVKLDPDDANFIGHMCYAAFKLWNVCDYERLLIIVRKIRFIPW